MQLSCWSLAHFPTNSHLRLPHCGNRCSSQPGLSLSFPLSQPVLEACHLTAASPAHEVCHLASVSLHLLPYWSCCSVCFFNSMVVGVPCSLIFWHFWLFIDFSLVVILLLVVRGSERFLPMPPSWLELPFLFKIYSVGLVFSVPGQEFKQLYDCAGHS